MVDYFFDQKLSSPKLCHDCQLLQIKANFYAPNNSGSFPLSTHYKYPLFSIPKFGGFRFLNADDTVSLRARHPTEVRSAAYWGLETKTPLFFKQKNGVEVVPLELIWIRPTPRVFFELQKEGELYHEQHVFYILYSHFEKYDNTDFSKFGHNRG